MTDASLINKLALGTVQFGLDYGISNSSGISPKSEVDRILRLAKDNEIDLLDTARLYGNSEEVLGDSEIDSFKLISKFALSEEYKNVSDSLFQSLNYLRVERLYALLAHRPNDIIENHHTWDEMNRLKDDGHVDKVGVSLYYPKELDFLLSKDIVPDIVQIPMSVLDQRFQPYLSELKNEGVEVHVRSTLLQGLFFIKPENLREKFEVIKPFICSIQEEFENDGELAAWLINSILSIPQIDKVVIGVNTKDQLESNLFELRRCESRNVNIPENVPDQIIIPSLW